MRRRPKLGQHFLKDAHYGRRIAEALPISSGDLVVEIGPGSGAMTGLLRERVRHVVAVELDAALAEKLQQEWQSDAGVEVLQADILTTDIDRLCQRHGASSCLVFGNLPYYITSPIIHHLLGFHRVIHGMALVVQSEVAERLAATPGKRAYGYLSVLAQIYSRPCIALRVPPGAFSPPPKVHSALVTFEMIPRLDERGRDSTERKLNVGDEARFLDFVKLCFGQKRKSVLNNLRGRYSSKLVERALTDLGLPAHIRAEQLALEKLADLYQMLADPQPPGRGIDAR